MPKLHNHNQGRMNQNRETPYIRKGFPITAGTNNLTQAEYIASRLFEEKKPRTPKKPTIRSFSWEKPVS